MLDISTFLFLTETTINTMDESPWISVSDLRSTRRGESCTCIIRGPETNRRTKATPDDRKRNGREGT